MIQHFQAVSVGVPTTLSEAPPLSSSELKPSSRGAAGLPAPPTTTQGRQERSEWGPYALQGQAVSRQNLSRQGHQQLDEIPEIPQKGLEDSHASTPRPLGLEDEAHA